MDFFNVRCDNRILSLAPLPALDIEALLLSPVGLSPRRACLAPLPARAIHDLCSVPWQQFMPKSCPSKSNATKTSTPSLSTATRRQIGALAYFSFLFRRRPLSSCPHSGMFSLTLNRTNYNVINGHKLSLPLIDIEDCILVIPKLWRTHNAGTNGEELRTEH